MLQYTYKRDKITLKKCLKARYQADGLTLKNTPIYT